MFHYIMTGARKHLTLHWDLLKLDIQLPELLKIYYFILF